MRFRTILLLIVLFFAGGSLVFSLFSSSGQVKKDPTEEEYIEATLKREGYPPYTNSGASFKTVSAQVYLPVKNFFQNQAVNPFGVFRSNRFVGYHSGVDVEIDPSDLYKKVPVYAIYDGEVKKVELAAGYGGVVAIEHDLGKLSLMGIYGHLRLWDINVKEGQKITAGYLIGYLGADASAETDGERKHLHFGLFKGEDVDIKGYVDSLAELKRNWLSPNEFLRGVNAKAME